MNKNKKSNRGFFITVFTALFTFLGNLINRSFFVSFFTDYENIETRCKSSKTSAVLSFISQIKYKTLNLKNKCAYLAEKSIAAELIDTVCGNFFRTNLRSVGIFMLSAGGLIVSANIAKNTEQFAILNFSNTFIFGVALILLSLIFIPKKNTSLSQSICESRILSYFLKDTFYIKHLDTTYKKEIYRPYAVAFIIGVAFGSVSYAISPFTAIYIPLIAFIIYMIFTKPENGVLLVCLLLPFMTDKLVVFIVLSICLSLLSKICRGKRSFKFNICSGAVIFTGLIMFSATAISFDKSEAYGTFSKIFIAMLLTLSVIMLITSTNLVEKCFKMLGFSVLLTVFIGVHDTILAVIYNEKISNIITHDFTATFANKESCAAFLIAVIPMFIIKHSVKSKIFSFVSLTVVVISLLLCNSYYAVLALFIALVISMILFSKMGIFTAFAVAACYGIFSFAVPKLTGFVLWEHMPKLEFMADKPFTSPSVTQQFFDKFLMCGTGIGSESAFYASAGDGLNITHINLDSGIYTDIIIQLGIPLAVLCALLIWIFAARMCSYAKSDLKSESAKSKCASLFTSVCAIGIYAFFSDFLHDIKILMLLFLILGLASATADSSDNDYISDKENLFHIHMQ